LGVPVIAGNTALGVSYTERPALHIPDPLSITTAALSIFYYLLFYQIFLRIYISIDKI
jgi:hypothetical protein